MTEMYKDKMECLVAIGELSLMVESYAINRQKKLISTNLVDGSVFLGESGYGLVDLDIKGSVSSSVNSIYILDEMVRSNTAIELAIGGACFEGLVLSDYSIETQVGELLARIRVKLVSAECLELEEESEVVEV